MMTRGRRVAIAAGALAIAVGVVAVAGCTDRGLKQQVSAAGSADSGSKQQVSAAGSTDSGSKRQLSASGSGSAAEAPAGTPPAVRDGRVLGQGANTKPTGAYRVKTYQVVEVVRAQPSSASGFNVAYRLTITGGPFVVRDLPVTVFLDGVRLGVAQESADLSAISVTVTDRSRLKEGAVIAVGYGDGDANLSELPERLHLA